MQFNRLGAVSVFCSSLGVDCVYQLTPALLCIMTSHFCVIVVFEYFVDMDCDYESTNMQINK